MVRDIEGLGFRILKGSRRVHVEGIRSTTCTPYEEAGSYGFLVLQWAL